MNKELLFKGLGVYIEKGFYKKETCRELIQEAQISASNAQAYVVSTDGEARLATDIRNTHQMEISEASRQFIKKRFEEVMPLLADFFGEKLTRISKPEFLGYGKGQFFKPHRDWNKESVTDQRKITAIILLNDQTNNEKETGYTGGLLNLYELFEQRPEMGMTVPSEAGLLIAFRSELLHEVTEITDGFRYSLVTWYG